MDKPAHQFPIAEHQAGGEADLLFVAERRHIIATGYGEFLDGYLPVHHLP